MTRTYTLTALAWLIVAVAYAAPLPAQESGLGPLGTQGGPVSYFIADGEAGSGYREGDRELATWALEAWERSADGALRFVPGPEATALVRVYWVRASAGQYGEMQPFTINGHRGAAVFVRPDTDALGATIGARARGDRLFRDTVVYLTCLHEIGHALGLGHTSSYDDVMYFFGFGGDIPGFFGRYRDRLRSRDDIASLAGLSQGDLAQLEGLYASP